MKRLVFVILILCLALLCAGTAFAANADAEPSSVFRTENGATITITNANAGQKYEFYQIFEVDLSDGSIKYKKFDFVSGFPNNQYFKVSSTNVATKKNDAVDDSGHLTSAAIDWLNGQKTNIGRKVAEVTPTESGTQVVKNLPYGYYFISTTTGSAVTVNSTIPNATVEDKNPSTTIDKEITGVGTGSVTADREAAIAQVGTVVSFEIRIPIMNGAKNYVFEDKMSHGLTLNTENITVKLANDSTGTPNSKIYKNNEYALQSNFTNETDDTKNDIYIDFLNSWVSDNVGKTIVINYSATVNNTAVIAGANPNTATIKWGNTSNPLTDSDTVNVYPARITVTKTDGSNAPLEGAKFILKNSSDQYYINTNGVISWGAENAATIVCPIQKTENGVKTGPATASFDGLANGTYTLIEKEAPTGCNEAADMTLTIKTADEINFSNADELSAALTLARTVVNQSGVTLPITGGIGTTIFYIIGGLLVIGAAVVLIARRKSQD